MKKPSRFVLILYGICALMWTVKVIVDIVEIVSKTYDNSFFLFVLHIFCAVIWIYIFIVYLKNYSNKDE